MRTIPEGWNDQYTLRYLYDRVTSLNGSAPVEDEGLRYVVNRLTEIVNQMKTDADAKSARIAELEAEIARLDAVKADRAGRKPKNSTA